MESSTSALSGHSMVRAKWRVENLLSALDMDQVDRVELVAPDR
jgi:hypothetical protein